MEQTRVLIDSLKRFLKSRGLTYRQIAQELDLSETTLKRCFSEGTFTLARLEAICSVAGLALADLARMSGQDEMEDGGVLTLEQEKGLASDPKLFSFFYLLIGGLTLATITQKYKFTESECTRLLLKLDKLKMVEALPKGRFRLIVSPNVRWSDTGPLHQRYAASMKREFMDAEFTSPGEGVRFLTSSLSESSLKVFERKLEKLMLEFRELGENERYSSKLEKTRRIWFLTAFRPWGFSVVHQFRR